MSDLLDSGASGADPRTGGLPGEVLLYSRDAFAEEFRLLLRARCRLLFTLGLLVSVVLVAFGRVALGAPAVLAGGSPGLEALLDAVHVSSFPIALASLYVGTPGVRRLQVTAFAVLVLNAVAAMMQPADFPALFTAALLLFVPAAVLPWRPAWQASLGAVTTFSFLAVQALVFASDPGRAYWEARGGGDAFREFLVASLLGVLVLAATSTFVSHTLYNLRRTARRARRLGSYRLEREIGRGGMATVHLARHARMVRPAALKVLHPRDADDGEAASRFEREVRLASTLTHPNTITIYDFGRAADGTFYYAMEYLEGCDLERLVRTHGPLPPERAVHLVLQVCGSLGEAHRRGVVHRDLKPSNVFVTERGGIHDFVKVLDFGIAKRLAPDVAERVTATGAIVGTPAYLAPEAIGGEGPVDARVDVYALGGLLFFLLTGRPPFEGASAVSILASHLREPPSPPSAVVEAGLPPGLDEIVLRCLEKDPKRRFAGVVEVEAALRGLRMPEGWSAERAAAWWSAHGV